MKIAACIEWMFADAGEDLAARVRAASAAGVKAVEFHLWREKPLDAIEAALKETGSQLLSFCVEPRRSLVDPADHEAVLAAVNDAIPVAQRFNSAMIVASGFTRPEVTEQEQFDAAITVLKRAAALAQQAGVMLWLEPVYMVINGQRMFVDTVGRGLDIVAAVDSPALRLLADAYHSAQTQEDFAAVISKRLPLIGHVQVADTNGRHEPGTGDIDWRPIMSALRQRGYQGHIGLEYFPSLPERASLEASKRALDMVE